MADVTDIRTRTLKGTARTDAGTRRTPNAHTTAPPPTWTTTYIVPKDSCEACERHWHHRCHGVNALLDPVPECPCPCGLPRDPMQLTPQAWADLAVHAPEQVWIAAMFERQRAAGIHMCVSDDAQERPFRAYHEPR
ncbi:hypothetical protein [Embleya sp. NBC_00896]|uniref:hypothetical protein n=1 Tax=Embleya sp. NBC_00896 TaxID=2975961 RepID=UPI002F9154B9|nr:hypothetical protein OG928_48255 [Embleya sp. NBC_00896]